MFFLGLTLGLLAGSFVTHKFHKLQLKWYRRMRARDRILPRSKRPPERKTTIRLSPECLAGECGSCNGVGCNHGCGHPARSRHKPGISIPEEPPF